MVKFDPSFFLNQINQILWVICLTGGPDDEFKVRTQIGQKLLQVVSKADKNVQFLEFEGAVFSGQFFFKNWSFY